MREQSAYPYEGVVPPGGSIPDVERTCCTDDISSWLDAELAPLHVGFGHSLSDGGNVAVMVVVSQTVMLCHNMCYDLGSQPDICEWDYVTRRQQRK